MSLNKIPPSAANQSQLIEHYQKAQEQRRNSRTEPGQSGQGQERVPGGDQAEISSQAYKTAALNRLLAAGRQALGPEPEVRHERLDEVRQRLDEGFYDSAAVREQVAARIGKIILASDIV